MKSNNINIKLNCMQEVIMAARNKETKELVEAIEKFKDIIGQQDERNSVLTEALESSLKLLQDQLFEKVRKQFHSSKKIAQRKKNN
jgi:hypothetical protein